MPEIFTRYSFPGIVSATGCTYTCSHGISPGVGVMRCNPQATLPPVTGDLVFFDGSERVVIPQARITRIRSEIGSSGQEWFMEFVDRRWRWRDFGAIAGWYNQLDPHGKLIPWTVRSPVELATYCLRAMGESGFSVDMPAGLSRAFGANFRNFMTTGTNLPPTGTNPPIDWRYIPPAQALQSLAEQFGRRVVYDPISNRVSVVRPGVGAALPPGSLSTISPSLSAPETPDGVAVIGSPTKYQFRGNLIAVGEEWDGSYRPINLLSYAPRMLGTVQKTRITINFNTLFTLLLDLPGSPGWDGNGLLIRIYIEKDNAIFTSDRITTPGDTPAAAAIAFAGAINATNIAEIRELCSAVAIDNTVMVTGRREGVSFTVRGQLMAETGLPYITDNMSLDFVLVQAASPTRNGWDYCPPNDFSTVRATDRLTLYQARELATKSVWKYYQLDERDVSGRGPIFVPGFGRVVRRQQVELLSSRVDQIRPEVEIPNAVDRLGRPVIENLYNGYSLDKPAAVFGSIAAQLTTRRFLTRNPRANTPERSQVFVGFTIDPVYQLVIFNSQVYYINLGGRFVAPTLTLETGCNVRDAETNQLVCFIRSRRIPGQSGQSFFTQTKPDIQLNVTATYSNEGIPRTVSILESDPINRADYYLAGMSLQYISDAAQTNKYNGIKAIPVDGAVGQVTWEVGENGVQTTASRNSEHSLFVPNYPARRRIEFLAPAQRWNLEIGANPPRS